jgi:hypothetical protein
MYDKNKIARTWVNHSYGHHPRWEAKPILEELEDATILFWLDGLDAVNIWSSHAILIYEKNGVLYEVNGSHCSCYGYEGQWRPEVTTWAALKMRQWDRFDKADTIREFLADK